MTARGMMGGGECGCSEAPASSVGMGCPGRCRMRGSTGTGDPRRLSLTSLPVWLKPSVGESIKGYTPRSLLPSTKDDPEGPKLILSS